jgi:hypothetical protein
LVRLDVGARKGLVREGYRYGRVRAQDQVTRTG